MDRLGCRFRFFEWLVHPPSLPLVKDGRLLVRHMRRERGTDGLSRVQIAQLEGDGSIGVVTLDDKRQRSRRNRPL